MPRGRRYGRRVRRSFRSFRGGRRRFGKRGRSRVFGMKIGRRM